MTVARTYKYTVDRVSAMCFGWLKHGPPSCAVFRFSFILYIVCETRGILLPINEITTIRYRVTSSADESAVLADGLTKIRNDILDHKFNVAMEKKISLNQAQKQFTGRSPRKKCICHCRGGRCGNRCGCRRKNNGKCSSACSCSGNCYHILFVESVS